MSHGSNTPPIECFDYIHGNSTGAESYLKWQVANIPVDILLGLNVLFAFGIILSPYLTEKFYGFFSAFSEDFEKKISVLGREYHIRAFNFHDFFVGLLIFVNVPALLILVVTNAII